MRHPLADAGGDVFFNVGAAGADYGDHQHGERGELQNAQLVISERDRIQVFNQPWVGLERSTLSRTTFSGQGSSRFATASPSNPQEADQQQLQMGPEQAG